MIESPVLQRLWSETRHRDVLIVLRARFGAVSPEIDAALRGVVDDDGRLDDLIDLALGCADLDAFGAGMASIRGNPTSAPD